MNKLEKALRKLRKKEQEAVLLTMMQLKLDFRKVPHVKALVGRKNWYRVRVGNYRIIFRVIFEVKNSNVEIMRITKRDDNTYRNL
ncbi:MAG: type II toxin-antitoxin system RelE/ParE family toxin [Patescibacteria group bacterium]